MPLGAVPTTAIKTVMINTMAPLQTQTCHYPVASHGYSWTRQWKVWNKEGSRNDSPLNDCYICSQAKYPTPQRMVRTCLNRKLYSQLDKCEMAGLECAIGFPSVCPSWVLNFTSCRHRMQRGLQGSADARKGMARE